MSSPPVSLTSSSVSSSASSVITRRASDSDIRGKLLNRLGIYDAPATAKAQPMTAAQHRRLRILRGMGVGYYTNNFSPPDGSAIRPPFNGVTPFVEPLKSPDDITSSRKAPPAKKKSTKIAFQDQVEVLPIPTRYEFSDRIKSRIWSNRHELQENAERNALEFASEGWNWKNVKEDDMMFICSQSGELVHPVHLQHLMEQEEAAANDGPSLERGTPVHG